jgi:hypothetical protein
MEILPIVAKSTGSNEKEGHLLQERSSQTTGPRCRSEQEKDGMCFNTWLSHPLVVWGSDKPMFACILPCNVRMKCCAVIVLCCTITLMLTLFSFLLLIVCT